MPSKQETSGAFPVLHTKRLKLRMLDPTNDTDCEFIVRLANDKETGRGGNSRVGINKVEDVRRKFQAIGPRTELCTLAPPPKGHYFVVTIPSAADEGEDTPIGLMSMSFRPEVGYPDLGYGILGPYQQQGYATEAGRATVQYWRDVIGVKQIWCGTMPDNDRSQKTARAIGFVDGGKLDLVFGLPGAEERITGAFAFILPGMKWKEGLVVYPTVH